MNVNGTHSELREGEIHLVNCTKADARCINYKTKRLGKGYLFQEGSLLKYYPLFVSKKEYEERG